MKNSLRIHKWTHNEFNIFILGVLTHPQRDCTVTASRLHCNGDAIWLLWQRLLAEKPPMVLQRDTSKPFFRSICTCFQVLNFGNNILHFVAPARCPWT